VGNASEEAQHHPVSRHTSSTWKSNIAKYDRRMEPHTAELQISKVEIGVIDPDF
jgi:hypothetical protein